MQEEFSYSAGYPYKSLTPEPFYTFNVKRSENQVAFELKIHDRPIQVLPESRFSTADAKPFSITRKISIHQMVYEDFLARRTDLDIGVKQFDKLEFG